MKLLEVNGLDVFYGKAQALRGVSFTVQEGEFASVIGSNGAGKTTLFNAISGLLPYQGEIGFAGQKLPSKPHEIVQSGLIHCPEGRSLFAYLSVLDNLQLGAYRRKDREIERDLRVVFELFPRLEERERQLVHTLSGGEQQMVAIGRALMGRPRLLLLDEPTLGLAPIVRSHISQALDAIQERYRMTILLAEQNADFAFKHSKRIYLLETGQIVREGTAEELKRDDYIRQAYLGS
ncbi:MAG: ABC transporter ATP-binding protein [Candidatus Fraserbacteria bacterium RBG_16_55_9]|uniref:ABC transporter ATP-binding protein n=1 Tax=Fraserbacteria sp. (strain RBG_16_55_9) TaxID=1817864 RepID=A0A1F5V2R3_FRAXR|nr:MAG: ABC transporter ATP-binding protein [Candidatus Fraserbacteria bacterium RBG_16_55_9]